MLCLPQTLALPSRWPAYHPCRLPLLDRGWVLAVVHVRGSGQLGPAWHLAGSRRLKHIGAADLLCAAGAMHNSGVAAAGRMCIEAASAGAACFNIFTRQSVKRISVWFECWRLTRG